MTREMTMAAAFLGVGAAIWFVLLRPVPIKMATGVIRSKTFKPAGEYVQYPVGDRQGFRTPTTIKLAEHFVLGIEVPGNSDEFRYAVNTAAASTFDVGEKVRIEYQTRGLPPFWRRTYVLEATRVD